MPKVTLRGNNVLTQVSAGENYSSRFLYNGTDGLQYTGENFCAGALDTFDSSKTQLTKYPGKRTLTSTHNEDCNVPGYSIQTNGTKYHMHNDIAYNGIILKNSQVVNSKGFSHEIPIKYGSVNSQEAFLWNMHGAIEYAIGNHNHLQGQEISIEEHIENGEEKIDISLYNPDDITDGCRVSIAKDELMPPYFYILDNKPQEASYETRIMFTEDRLGYNYVSGSEWKPYCLVQGVLSTINVPTYYHIFKLDNISYTGSIENGLGSLPHTSNAEILTNVSGGPFSVLKHDTSVNYDIVGKIHGEFFNPPGSMYNTGYLVTSSRITGSGVNLGDPSFNVQDVLIDEETTNITYCKRAEATISFPTIDASGSGIADDIGIVIQTGPNTTKGILDDDINAYSYGSFVAKDINHPEYTASITFLNGYPANDGTHNQSAYKTAQGNSFYGLYQNINPFRYDKTACDTSDRYPQGRTPGLHSISIGADASNGGSGSESAMMVNNLKYVLNSGHGLQYDLSDSSDVSGHLHYIGNNSSQQDATPTYHNFVFPTLYKLNLQNGEDYSNIYTFSVAEPPWRGEYERIASGPTLVQNGGADRIINISTDNHLGYKITNGGISNSALGGIRTGKNENANLQRTEFTNPDTHIINIAGHKKIRPTE